jgi:hypothetical protein
MANYRLTEKTDFGTTQVDYRDLLHCVDISDSTGSADGTSKKIKAERFITTVTSSLDNASVQALNVTPLGLFNPGAGFIVIPIAVTIVTTYASLTEASNNHLYIGYDSSQTVVYWDYVSRFMGGLTSSNTWVLSGANQPAKGVNTATIESLPLEMWSGGAFTGGWTCKVYATLSITPAI